MIETTLDALSAALIAGEKVQFHAVHEDGLHETTFEVQTLDGWHHLMAEGRHVASFAEFPDLWRAAIAILPKELRAPGEGQEPLQ